VVVAAGPIAVMLSRHTAAPPDGSGSALRNKAAVWISQQVSPNAVVSCDLAMCQTLEAYGVGTGNLLVMNSGADQLPDSQVVVSTSAIRQMFGGRLASDAPAVLASFGSGKARIEVRVIAQKGSKVYLSQLNTDVQERKNLGNQLAPQLTLSPTARRQLIAGQVDTRLMVVLAFILGSSTGQLSVLGFGDLGPGATAGVPLRSVYLAETGTIGNARSTLASLRANAPYRPSHVGSTRYDGHPALYIEYSAPVPFGLMGNQGP
jgi:hypothetical protein